MLQHHSPEGDFSPSVVLLGAHGFIGRACQSDFSAHGIAVTPVTSAEVDLAADDATETLSDMIAAQDAVVMLAAQTPDKGRGVDTMMRNIRMVRNLCAALDRRPCAHLIYISSDAVYAPEHGRIDEETCAAPKDLYGSMHKIREVMLQSSFKDPLAILRPTLVYGADDTHNSYGPNRFRRQAASDSKIILGGNGEETRDHAFVGDIAAVIRLCLTHRSSGCLNVATGRSVSFAELAGLVAMQFSEPINIEFTPRNVPITHRSFDVTACHKAFPRFAFTPLEDGISLVHREIPDQAG